MNTSPFLGVPAERIIASNDLAIALHDLYPVSPGHTLIVTKRVIETWWDATGAEKIAVIELVDAVKVLLDAEYNPDGYNVGFNAGAVGGQTVPHLHIHVIPRYVGDVSDPRGGIRHVIPHKAKYWSDDE
jgi:diadenosine tetraphosphate (Ap4A) HIT family hydrolase